MELFVEETGDLIECGEKKGKKSVEEMESVSTTDVPGQGKMKGKPSNKCRGHKNSLWKCNCYSTKLGS